MMEEEDGTTDDPVPTCKGCIFFFITYDLYFPYGCRGFGFKSRNNPYIEVQTATGEPCLMRQDNRSLLP